MRGWFTGCGLILLIACVAMVRVCQPPEGASYVQLIYPDERGAPNLTNVRVLWSGENAAYDVVRPGQHFGYLMNPIGGGGELTVLFTLSGERHSWTGRIGQPGARARYGVQIQISPLGVVTETHCTHPCPGSGRPWYEPYRTRILEIFGLIWTFNQHFSTTHENTTYSGLLDWSRGVHGPRV
jgi:hypothetical protein